MFSELQLQETQDAKSLPNNSCQRSSQPRTMHGPAAGTERHPGSPWPEWGQPPVAPHREPGSRGQPPPPRPHPQGGLVSFFLPPLNFSFRGDSFPLHWWSSWAVHGWLLHKVSHQPGPPRGHPGPPCAAWPSGSVTSQGDTLSTSHACHHPTIPPTEKGTSARQAPRDPAAHKS